MNEITRQVNRARRRMLTGIFFSVLIWSAFVALMVAAIAVAVPKIWHLAFLQEPASQGIWRNSWILGCSGLALLVATCLTWLKRGSVIDAAVEVDRRFGLKERISSALMLSPGDRQSSAGQALVGDAQRRAGDIEISERFQFKPSGFALMPLVPVLLLVALMFVPNAQPADASENPEKIDKKKIELQVKEFKKKVEETRKQLEAKGLQDASNELKSLGKKFDRLLGDEDRTQKETLVKLNDIKKEIEDRRKQIGDSSEFKKNLNKLKNVGKGPAKKLASAIGDGDFKKAKEAMQQLADQLKQGKMDADGVRKLADDLKKLANAIKKDAENRQREIDELKEKVQKAQREGDLDKAAKLQEKLEQKEQQQEQMKKMNKVAEQLQKAANKMQKAAGQKPGQPQGKQGQDSQQPKDRQPGQPGNDGQSGEAGENGQPQEGEPSLEDLKQAMQGAGKSLEDIAKQMEDLQKQLEEMEALENLEDIAEECKNGCQGGQPGEGNNNDKPQWADWAKGSGKGKGLRDRDEDGDTGTFKARVKGKLGKGETIVTGTADGENISGRSVTETKELIRASMDRDVDPLENQKLTKKQREHAAQYFKALREQ